MKEIKKSAEDYLETILTLSKTKEHVRSIDVVNELGFSKPSVSVAMKKLKTEGYIFIDDFGHITLTETGLTNAERIYERHTIISSLLISLGVSEEVALADACKIEHELSEEAFVKIKEYYYKNN